MYISLVLLKDVVFKSKKVFMKNIKQTKNLINLAILTTFVGIFGLTSKPVFAYDNPEVDTKLRIEKDVKLDGDTNWKDKVFIDLNKSSEKDKDVLFRVKVSNLSDSGAAKFDKMQMKDFLPGELYRVGGAYLKENWNEFASGETKEFIIKVKLTDAEMNMDKRFEKCVVNKAELRQDGNFEGSDTATVCYGNIPVEELPKTGFTSVASIVGMIFLGLGSAIKLGKRTA